jgi:hypothetical protein
MNQSLSGVGKTFRAIAVFFFGCHLLAIYLFLIKGDGTKEFRNDAFYLMNETHELAGRLEDARDEAEMMKNAAAGEGRELTPPQLTAMQARVDRARVNQDGTVRDFYEKYK